MSVIEYLESLLEEEKIDDENKEEKRDEVETAIREKFGDKV
ncbi:hypothetical protein MHB50_13805 [Siminovitchia sp. FSL H7-0308]|uniref:Uncharacterized protein n=1 Tax=Siminovitchia thermophila TaxID=1245522 RepID=A0ABS2R0V5_9BACI|nr:hypothetical protein [Siminovitchia thermophila]MBM7713276.1 hypothetical protein [Siminovitchia thermophila]